MPGKSHEQEPGGLQSIGLQRVGNNNSVYIYTHKGKAAMHWAFLCPEFMLNAVGKIKLKTTSLSNLGNLSTKVERKITVLLLNKY